MSELIASVVPAEFCLVAGVSDWGTQALIAALSILAERDLLPGADQVEGRLDAVLAAGAVDGLSGLPARTIDGVEARQSGKEAKRRRVDGIVVTVLIKTT